MATEEETADWLIHLNGEQRGPLTAAMIQEGLEHGTLSPADWVWREGQADWIQIRDVAELDTASAPPVGRTRWRLWLAFACGLIVSAIAAGVNYQKFLQSWQEAPIQNFAAEAIGYLAAGPLLFTLIAVIRNLIVCRRP